MEPLRRHSIRQHDRQARVPAQPAEMRDGFQPMHDGGEAFVRQHQRVAAAEQHLANRRVVFESLKRWLPIVETFRFLRVRVMPAEAVSTVNRTRTGEHEQCSAFVLVQQSRKFAVSGFVECVVLESRDFGFLRRDGQHLTQQRVVEISGPNAFQKALGHEQRKFFLALPRSRHDVVRKLQSSGQFARVANGLSERATPVRQRLRSGTASRGNRQFGEGEFSRRHPRHQPRGPAINSPFSGGPGSRKAYERRLKSGFSRQIPSAIVRRVVTGTR